MPMTPRLPAFWQGLLPKRQNAAFPDKLTSKSVGVAHRTARFAGGVHHWEFAGNGAVFRRFPAEKRGRCVRCASRPRQKPGDGAATTRGAGGPLPAGSVIAPWRRRAHRPDALRRLARSVPRSEEPGLPFDARKGRSLASRPPCRAPSRAALLRLCGGPARVGSGCTAVASLRGAETS